ncbi:MAG: hypothetical protein LJE91_09895 [Gammaproteobacteria bacterium]|jgi:hypothetical protein|nr:hypothetical protein [Gammaproteobacteria bacterium]
MSTRAEVACAVIVGEGRRAVNGVFRLYHDGRRLLAGIMNDRFRFKGESAGARVAVLIASALGGAILVTLACNRNPENLADSAEAATPPVPVYPMAKAIPAAVPQITSRQRAPLEGPVPDSVARQMGYPPLNYAPDGKPDTPPGQTSQTTGAVSEEPAPGRAQRYPDYSGQAAARARTENRAQPQTENRAQPRRGSPYPRAAYPRAESRRDDASSWAPVGGSAGYQAPGGRGEETWPRPVEPARGYQGPPPQGVQAGSSRRLEQTEAWSRRPAVAGDGYSGYRSGAAAGSEAPGGDSPYQGRQAGSPGYETGGRWSTGGIGQDDGSHWPGTWRTPEGAPGAAMREGAQSADQYPPLPYYGNR